MKLLSLLCAALVVFVIPLKPVEAQTYNSNEFPIEGSEGLFTRDLFSITRCMAKRDTEEVKVVLADRKWSFLHSPALQEIAKRNNSCITRGTQLRGNLQTFLQGLATALFVEKYQDTNLPSYAGTPQAFSLDDFGKLSPQRQATEIKLALNECAFRLAPQKAKDFLDSEPTSKEADRMLGGIMAAYETCLQGTQMPDIAPTRIRGLLGLAAYYVDLAYESHTNGAT